MDGTKRSGRPDFGEMNMTRKLESLTQIAALSAAIALFASSVALAQTPASAGTVDTPSQADLFGTPEFARRLQGTKVVVTTADGKQRSGVFTVSAAGLVANGQATDGLLPFDQVMKVERSSHRMAYSVLIGLGSGFAVARATCERGRSCVQQVPFTGIGAGVGSAVGAVLNAYKRNDDLIFDVGPRYLSSPAFADLVAGKNVWLTTSDGHRSRERVVALSATEMTVVGNTRRSVAFTRIVKVQEVSHRMRNGILIGLGTGAGVGLAAGLACGEAECLVLLPVLAGMGVGIGAGVAALVHAGNNGGVVYDATRRSSTRTMAVAPILSPTRKGVAFSMTWR
jgi:hypothetical protein